MNDFSILPTNLYIISILLEIEQIILVHPFIRFFFLTHFLGWSFFFIYTIALWRSVRGKRDVFNVWSFFFFDVLWEKWRYQGENIWYFFVECKIRWIEYKFLYWKLKRWKKWEKSDDVFFYFVGNDFLRKLFCSFCSHFFIWNYWTSWSRDIAKQPSEGVDPRVHGDERSSKKQIFG